MSTNKKQKAERVKELALAGCFESIRLEFGESSVQKALEYVRVGDF